MKLLLSLIAASVVFMSSANAQIKDCDELKDEIQVKIKNNGVKSFDLRIVENDEVNEHKNWTVVGSCQNGTNKVLYKRQ